MAQRSALGKPGPRMLAVTALSGDIPRMFRFQKSLTRGRSLRLFALPALLAGLTYLGRADATCSACLAPPAATAEQGHSAALATPEPVGHPLRGLVVKVLPDQKALLVKHEEIPGVMRAMTMVLKVNAETLAAAQAGQAITGTLIKLEDGWWLRDVKASESPTTKTQ